MQKLKAEICQQIEKKKRAQVFNAEDDRDEENSQSKNSDRSQRKKEKPHKGKSFLDYL